jgi:hypothetical protein
VDDAEKLTLPETHDACGTPDKLILLNEKRYDAQPVNTQVTSKCCNCTTIRRSRLHYSVTTPGATKLFLPDGTTLVTMHVIIGGLFWLLSL